MWRGARCAADVDALGYVVRVVSSTAMPRRTLSSASAGGTGTTTAGQPWPARHWEAHRSAIAARPELDGVENSPTVGVERDGDEAPPPYATDGYRHETAPGVRLL